MHERSRMGYKALSMVVKHQGEFGYFEGSSLVFVAIVMEGTVIVTLAFASEVNRGRINPQNTKAV